MFWRLPKNKWVGERNKTIKDFTSYQRTMTDILDFKTSPKEYRVWHKTWSSQPSEEGEGVINWMMRVRSIYQSNKWNRYVQWWEWSMWVPIEDVVLLQRTGLFDKNGVKIREGDIVEAGSKGEIRRYVVKRNNARGWFFLVPLGWRKYERTRKDNYINGKGNKTVIGNVFENSDLLQ